MPRRPPKGHKCDATTGSGSDMYRAPVLYGCTELATVTITMPDGQHVLWYCQGHADSYQEVTG